MSDWDSWIGRSEVRHDTLEPARSQALTIALGFGSGNEDHLPSLHHWLYFWDVRPPAGLGADGHPARGDFLPPIPLPRRMWAGGRLRFLAPLKLGTPVHKTSTILSISQKSGRSGELCFVTVGHQLFGADGLAIEEEQDLVYRPAASAAVSVSGDDSEAAHDWDTGILPDPVLLFRYSALTMNGHRIHYDAPYAASVEHYPGLVVQGPLQATLLLTEAERRRGLAATTFAFRGKAPAIEGRPLHLRGKQADARAEVWAQQAGQTTMTAEVGWEVCS